MSYIGKKTGHTKRMISGTFSELECSNIRLLESAFGFL